MPPDLVDRSVELEDLRYRVTLEGRRSRLEAQVEYAFARPPIEDETRGDSVDLSPREAAKSRGFADCDAARLDYIASRTSEIPCPPPMHIVTRP